MDAKQDQIDAVGVTAEDKAIYDEEIIALTADYNAKKAISDAYEVTFKAEVTALNAAYTAAIAGVEAAEATKTVADDAKAATAAEADAINVIKTEVNRLNALVFIYNTSTEETKIETLENMTDAIADAIEGLEDDIKDVEGDIYDAEKVLAAIESGDYSQAQAVRDQELAIVKAESNIEKLKLMVAEAKVDLDNKQAEYNALLN
jgi:chromosome segregation ATPase